MESTGTSQSAKIRERLNHPIIDTDGHTVELMPVFFDYLKRFGGADMINKYQDASARRANNRWVTMSEEERHDARATCPPWWARPARNTLDCASASLPRLLHRRMDELGLDFTVLYPTEGLFTPPTFADEEIRRISCRALNAYHADVYREYADRMTPVAVIPAHTPQEGIEELEYAVNELGLKAMVTAHVERPVPKVGREHPDISRHASYLDLLALDSEYDYDPFWAKCVELKVAVTTHSSGMGWGSRRSISNYMFNHIGHFGASGEAMCKALFFGGVTRRFPTLPFAFLEGGVSWACSLFADMIEHWEKRNTKAIGNLDPKSMDIELFKRLVDEYGEDIMKGMAGEIVQGLKRPARRPSGLDDWAKCRIESLGEIRDLFVPNFFFGCEADDRMVAWAFNSKVNPMGVRLGAMMSSDIGHWDVSDMTKVVGEAYELVEDGLISEADFRDFTFTNSVRLYAGLNRDFFKGTVCESAVDGLLSEGPLRFQHTSGSRAGPDHRVGN
ncbi:MAG: amidohydrolase family protein [Candidatus Binatia bacterium]